MLSFGELGDQATAAQGDDGATVEAHAVPRLLGEQRSADADPGFLPELHRWLERTLRGCTDGAVREVRIVLGELVGNAVRHGLAPFAVRLLLSGNGHVVRLEVDDGGSSASAGWPVRGGLRVVRGLCQNWGVEPGTVGKTVWAELPVLVPPAAC